MVVSYLLVAVAAAVVTAATVPIMSRLARRVGALAVPNDRRVHTEATPVLGGGAMFLGLVGGLGVAATLGQFDSMFESIGTLASVMAAATVMFAVGVIDDVKDVSAPAKTAGTVLSGSILSLGGISIVNLPLPWIGFTVLSPDLAALATVLFVVVLANAVNLIDGLDGLAAGVMAVASGAFLLYSVKLDTEGLLDTGNPGPLMAVITVGVCIGFLFWNFHPAKIFMGDSGALLLGLMMASSSIAVGGQSDESFTGQSWFFFAPLVIPILILGVPLADMLFAILRRATRRSGLAVADKDHLHHRLLRLGHGHRRSVLILWAWTALLSAFALFPAVTGKAAAMVPIGVAAAALLLFTLLWPRMDRRRSGAGAAEDPSTPHRRADDPPLDSAGAVGAATRAADGDAANDDAADGDAANGAADVASVNDVIETAAHTVP